MGDILNGIAVTRTGRTSRKGPISFVEKPGKKDSRKGGKFMAVEEIRGCGYRKIGGVYLVGDGPNGHCDRLPIPIRPCGTCGEDLRFNRSIAKIDPHKLWGWHSSAIDFADEEISKQCECPAECPLCNPEPPVVRRNGLVLAPGDRFMNDSGEVIRRRPEGGSRKIFAQPEKPSAGRAQSYLMWVGDDYTVESFLLEARTMGVSKRIPAIPKDLEVGKSWIYLSKLRVIPQNGQSWLPFEPVEKRGQGPGVFYAFRPTAIEVIVSEEDYDFRADEYREMGVTPVPVPANDPDHRQGSAGAGSRLIPG